MKPRHSIKPAFDYSEIEVVPVKQGRRTVYRHTGTLDALKRWIAAKGFVTPSPKRK